jgi:hypothetical protein
MPNPVIRRPEATEHCPEFGNYIRLVPQGDIQSILDSQLSELHGLLDGLSDHESLMHHAPHTWSIRQVVGHMTDCERVFGYRALRIARNDATPLSTFDENAYMKFADFDRWPLAELLTEFDLVRRSHLLLFRHLQPPAWLHRGVVIDRPTSTRALAYLIAGHAKHHLDILHKRLRKE